MKPSLFNRFTSLMTVAFLLSGPAFALDFQWDVNGSAAGLGGAGTWNTTNTFWDDTASGANDGTAITKTSSDPNP